MKILLIEPPGIDPGLNSGLAYLAAVLEKYGNEVRVLDFNNKKERKFERLEAGLKWGAEIVGFSIKSLSLEESCKLARFCIEKKPGIICVAGGAHVIMEQENFMKENPGLFKASFIGESEESFVEFVEAIKQRKSLRKVKGIIYEDNGKIIKTEKRDLIKNINELPFPDYSVFDSVPDKMDYYPIITSRGCPYQCVFCLNKYISCMKWRPRTPESVIEEIKLARKKYNIKRFAIWDDNFTMDISRAEKFCDLLEKEKIDIYWSLPDGIRGDRVDEKLLRKMKKTGCYSVKIGVENADPATYKLVKKGESLESIERAVKLIKKVGMKVSGFMVIGLIDTTYQSFLNSLEFSERIGLPCNWYIAAPYPHTELYDWAIKHGRFYMDYKKAFHSGASGIEPPVVFDTKEFPKEQRIRAYYIGNLRGKAFTFFRKKDDYLVAWMFRVIKLGWKYDREKLARHIFNSLTLIPMVHFAQRSKPLYNNLIKIKRFIEK